MTKYRKKPVVIEAFRMGIDPRPDWFQSEVAKNRIVTDLTSAGYRLKPIV